MLHASIFWASAYALQKKTPPKGGVQSIIAIIVRVLPTAKHTPKPFPEHANLLRLHKVNKDG